MKITKTKSKFNKISEDLIKSFNSRSKEKSPEEKSKHKSQIIDKEKIQNLERDQNYECSSDIYLDFIEYIKINYIDSINKLIRDEGVYYSPQVALDFDNKHHYENGSSVKGVLVANIESLQIMKDIISSILDKKQTTISEILYESSKKYEEQEEEFEEEEQEEEFEEEEQEEEFEEEEQEEEEEEEEEEFEGEYWGDEVEEVEEVEEEEDDKYETEEELNELSEFDNYSEEKDSYLEEDEY
jgi:hypothetical protein